MMHNHHLIGHILVTWGFWLSGIAIGYTAAKRDWRKATREFSLACTRREHEVKKEAMNRTLGGVDLGPWIERCKDPR